MTIELIMRVWATYTVVVALALLTASATSKDKADSIGVADVCLAFGYTWPFATAVMVIWLL